MKILEYFEYPVEFHQNVKMFLEFHYVSSSIKLLHFMSRWAELVTDKINGFWRIKVDVMLKWVVDLPVLYFGSQKMHFLCFQAVFELTLDSLTTIQVDPHQCHLHQFLRIGSSEHFSFFESAILKKKIPYMHHYNPPLIRNCS